MGWERFLGEILTYLPTSKILQSKQNIEMRQAYMHFYAYWSFRVNVHYPSPLLSLSCTTGVYNTRPASRLKPAQGFTLAR